MHSAFNGLDTSRRGSHHPLRYLFCFRDNCATIAFRPLITGDGLSFDLGCCAIQRPAGGDGFRSDSVTEGRQDTSETVAVALITACGICQFELLIGGAV